MTRTKPDPDSTTLERLDSYQMMETPPSSRRAASLTPGREGEMPNISQTYPPTQSCSTPFISPSAADDVSEQDDALQSIGADSRQLISFIQKLENLSIKEALPSLPKFVVVGDQSAGKSSTIEALCDIRLPRGEGTCTRCPFRITTTSSKGDSWQCRVSVHLKYRHDLNVQAGQSSPYKHWIEEEGEVTVHEIATTSNREDLELELRRAQIAILNPEHSPIDFVGIDMSPYLASQDMESEGLIGVAFSPNWVALEISSPNLPELSLYDLPGAINVHPDEDSQYLVKFVGDLMKSYMREENTLVLMACPMNSDIHNTIAFLYVRQCKALERTMGVRTKPDLVKLDHKRLAQEVSVLKGQDFKLGGGGWYITKQCSQDEIDQGNISYAEARRMEDDFFAQGIWTEVLGDFRDRLGTRNLQAALSKKLTAHIRDEVPTIVERIHTRCAEVEKELAKFPAPEENATVTIMKELGALISQVRTLMSEDVPEQQTISNKCRILFKSLEANLNDCKPELILVTPGWTPKTIEIGDDEVEEDEPSPSKKAKHSKGRSVPTVPAQQESKARKHRSNQTSRSSQTVSQPQTPTKLRIQLNELRQKFESAPGADITGEIDVKVIRQLMRQSLCGWPAAVEKLRQDLKALFTAIINQALTSIEARRGTGFYDAVNRSVWDFLEESLKELQTHIYEAVACEQYTALTMSKHYSLESRKLASECEQQRDIQRVKEYFDDPPEGVQRLNDKDQTKKAADHEWVTRNLGDDDYEQMILAFARVAAYYNTTSAQFVDQISKRTHFFMLKSFDARLFNRLVDKLQVSDRNFCEQLLVRDPTAQWKYQNLRTEQKKLTAAIEELRSL